MYNRELVFTILSQILEASERIKRRFAVIQSPDDFLKSDDGIDRLDLINPVTKQIHVISVKQLILAFSFQR